MGAALSVGLKVRVGNVLGGMDLLGGDDGCTLGSLLVDGKLVGTRLSEGF